MHYETEPHSHGLSGLPVSWPLAWHPQQQLEEPSAHNPRDLNEKEKNPLQDGKEKNLMHQDCFIRQTLRAMHDASMVMAEVYIEQKHRIAKYLSFT